MRFLVLVFAVMLSSPAWACDLKFEKLNACGTVEFSKAPVAGKDSPFLLTLTSLVDGKVLELPTSALEVVLWMPSMGHGSRPTQVTRFEKSGAAYVSNVYFMMGGDWEVRVSFTETLANGTKSVVDKAVLALDL